MSGGFHVGDNINQFGNRNIGKIEGTPAASNPPVRGMANPVPGEPLVFINYRMTDDKAATFIDVELTRRLGRGAVFRDAKMPAGTEFPAELIGKASTCKVMIAIIGEKWDDTYGLNLLKNHSDWVRREIAAALVHGVYVAPVLVGARKRPAAGDLPREIRRLAYLQVRHLRTGYDEEDVRRLVDELLDDVPALRGVAFRGR